mmetsp:Transcript_23154/g.53239  ORF Transcript_23154/g.53239 Transcript_23154/m.53239 type:complete len:202 (-) Transcript_23154:16-621(-)
MIARIVWLILALLWPAKLGNAGPQEVRFDRLSKVHGAEDDAKQIAKEIRCDVCLAAARHILEQLANAKGKTSEASVLEQVASLCLGSEGAESFDVLMERSNWTVVKSGGHHRLEQHPRPRLHGEVGLLDGFALRESVKQACVMVIDEYQSEMAEYLFVSAQVNRASGSKLLGDITPIVQRLCGGLSSACSRGQLKVGEHEL